MRKYPLFIILILSLLIVSIPGAVISIRDRSFTYPAAAVMIQTIKNGQLMRIIGASDPGATDPGAVAAAAIREARGSQSTAVSDAPEATEAKAKSAGNTVSEGNQEKSEKTDDQDIVKEPKEAKTETNEIDKDAEDETDDNPAETENEEDEDNVDDPEDEPEEEALKEFTTVGNDYFEDACLVGDSRVQGLGLYSDLPATNYGIVSMQLYRVFDKRVISTDAGKVTIPEALAMGTQYGKIYLGFGLNEMGWGNDEMFAEYYYGLIDYIKAVQPDAIIYIMGLIHVTEREEQSSSLYTNEKINHRNELLKEIAENEHVYYLDLNEVFTDENGRLAAEDSFDGIHIKAGAIDKWADYLRTHAIED